MSKWKLRTVIALLVCCCTVGGCGGCGSKKEETTTEEDEYDTLGMKKGADGWYYKKGDDTGYYDAQGNRYEIGDTEIAFDDMLFSYLKSVSMLDFSAAYNYLVDNETSTVINSYLENSVDDELASTSVDTDVVTFNRQIYKQFLLSLEAVNIEDTVYAGDSNIVTVKVKHKDLTNLDFWRSDYQEIMDELLEINENSNSYDDVDMKTVEYLTNYILECYSKSDAPTKESQVEILVTKSAQGAWQVSDDSDLAKLAQDNNGSYIVEKIENEFNDYYADWREEQYKKEMEKQQQ